MSLKMKAKEPEGSPPNKHDELDALVERFSGPIEGMFDEFRGEQDKRMDERDTALMERLSKQIEEGVAKFQAEWEKADRKYQAPGHEDGDDGRRKGQHFSIARMCRAVASKDWTLAPFEKEVVTEIHKVMSTDVDTAGGYLVPEVQATTIIDLLRAQTVVIELGATEYTGGRPFPYRIPKLTADSVATWIDENQTIPESTPTIGQVTLSPRKLASLVKLSSETVMHSTPVADQVVTNSIAMQMALALDLAALNGTGNGQPIGVVSLAGNSVDFSAGTDPQLYFGLVKMIREQSVDNAFFGSVGWAAHPDVIFKVQTGAGDKGSSGSDPEVARRLLTEKSIDNLIGHPYRTTTQLTAPTGTATGSLILGNWADLIIGRWSALAIRASDTAGGSFEADQLFIRGILHADINVQRANSFCIDTNFPAI